MQVSALSYAGICDEGCSRLRGALEVIWRDNVTIYNIKTRGNGNYVPLKEANFLFYGITIYNVVTPRSQKCMPLAFFLCQVYKCRFLPVDALPPS